MLPRPTIPTFTSRIDPHHNIPGGACFSLPMPQETACLPLSSRTPRLLRHQLFPDGDTQSRPLRQVHVPFFFHQRRGLSDGGAVPLRGTSPAAITSGWRMSKTLLSSIQRYSCTPRLFSPPAIGMSTSRFNSASPSKS